MTRNTYLVATPHRSSSVVGVCARIQKHNKLTNVGSGLIHNIQAQSPTFTAIYIIHNSTLNHKPENNGA